MKAVWYKAGTSFQQQKKEADKKHIPMYLRIKKLKASDDTIFYSAGDLGMVISAGKLESCRRLTVSETLNSKLALGRCYRVAGVGNYMNGARIIVKLRWQDSQGYFTGKKKADEPCEEHIFAIPEDVFLKTVYRLDMATPA